MYLHNTCIIDCLYGLVMIIMQYASCNDMHYGGYMIIMKKFIITTQIYIICP